MSTSLSHFAELPAQKLGPMSWKGVRLKAAVLLNRESGGHLESRPEGGGLLPVLAAFPQLALKNFAGSDCVPWLLHGPDQWFSSSVTGQVIMVGDTGSTEQLGF